MEENSDPIKEIINKQEEPDKKSSPIENNDKNLSRENNLNSKNNVVEANNKKVNASIKNNLSNENNKEKIGDKTPSSFNKDINKIKIDEGLESAKAVKIKPKKEIPIEKKPFNEFINDHLLPSIINQFKERGLEVNEISFKKTSRPIAGDECWVIYCDIKDICNFWLSFEKEDITSLKSISLSKFNQKPSIIESFLIDEKRITLQLIISRILQRLNGQKLIGIN